MGFNSGFKGLMLFRKIIAVCSEIRTQHLMLFRKIIAVCSEIRTQHLMLFRKIIAVCSEIRTQHLTMLCGQKVEYLGEFAKNCDKRLLASPCLSVCLALCPSARNSLVPNWLVFVAFDIWENFGNLSWRIQVFIKIWQE